MKEYDKYLKLLKEKYPTKQSFPKGQRACTSLKVFSSG